MRATLKFSVETDLTKLVQHLLFIVVQHAGASRATLFLRNEQSGGWGDALSVSTDAGGEADDEELRAPLVIGGVLSDLVPMSVLNYVLRTRETCVLNSPQMEGVFASDPYLQKHQPKAALMIPILHQV